MLNGLPGLRSLRTVIVQYTRAMNGHDGTDLYTAAQVRELDARAIAGGIPGYELMQRAGAVVVDELLQRYPGAGSASVMCGRGNNAGDGYVVARLLKERGVDARVEQLGPARALGGDAALARDAASAAGVPVREHEDERPSIDNWGDVLVDALLGTGAVGPLRPAFAATVQAMNAAQRPIVAVDLPTGVQADTGAVEQDVVRASVTVSFIGRKRGLFTGAALSVCGERVFDDLGVPPAVFAGLEGAQLRRFDGRRLPEPDLNAYKHALGHVLVVGGDQAMGGAVLMAAEAALRSGAGLVTVATHPAHRTALLTRRPELMVIDAESDAVEELLERVSVLALGPGLGRGAWGRNRFEALSARARLPTVVDADGLRLLAGDSWPAASECGLVLTPHVAEAAALLGCSTADVQADRFGAAAQLSERYQAWIILKGAGSITAGPSGNPIVCGHGNPGMATAGMGDVLTGIVAGLWAQGLRPGLAAELGMLLHSAAGDRAAEAVGQRSLLATDLFDALPALLRDRLAVPS